MIKMTWELGSKNDTVPARLKVTVYDIYDFEELTSKIVLEIVCHLWWCNMAIFPQVFSVRIYHAKTVKSVRTLPFPVS